MCLRKDNPVFLLERLVMFDNEISVTLTDGQWFAVRAALLIAAHNTQDISYKEIEIEIDKQIPSQEE